MTPEQHYSRKMAEMEAQNKDIANEEFVSVYDLIWGAFTWGKSKMGYEYWIGMADNCKALGI